MSEDPFAQLQVVLRQTALLENVLALLGWDEQVNLPPAAAAQRAEEAALVATCLHREATRPEIGDWLASLEAAPHHDSQTQAILAEARRRYHRMTCLPASFVARKTAAQSRAYHTWLQARGDRDFSRFAPELAEQLSLAREEADFLGFGQNPYDSMIDMHDPGLDSTSVDLLFAPLRQQLPTLAAQILDSLSPSEPPPALHASIEQQEALIKTLLPRLGFDFDAGRMDTAPHPFCSGMGKDIRLTTRYNTRDPFDALYAAIHEAGHGMYEQGLDPQALGLATGRHAGMAIHESQSRLWENQMARSLPFWKFCAPLLQEHFSLPAPCDPVAFHKRATRVRQTPIRVDADEVTYNLHILLRFDIEKRLFDGSLEVCDLPEAWNARAKDLLGSPPAHDAEGVLQDVHWAGGAFGYFPSYALGNMIAAQLWESLHSDLPHRDALVEQGDFAPIRHWLHERIHRHGRTLPILALVEEATGRPLSASPLLEYLRTRYLR